MCDLSEQLELHNELQALYLTLKLDLLLPIFTSPFGVKVNIVS